MTLKVHLPILSVTAVKNVCTHSTILQNLLSSDGEKTHRSDKGEAPLSHSRNLQELRESSESGCHLCSLALGAITEEGRTDLKGDESVEFVTVMKNDSFQLSFEVDKKQTCKVGISRRKGTCLAVEV